MRCSQLVSDNKKSRTSCNVRHARGLLRHRLDGATERPRAGEEAGALLHFFLLHRPQQGAVHLDEVDVLERTTLRQELQEGDAILDFLGSQGAVVAGEHDPGRVHLDVGHDAAPEPVRSVLTVDGKTDPVRLLQKGLNCPRYEHGRIGSCRLVVRLELLHTRRLLVNEHYCFLIFSKTQGVGAFYSPSPSSLWCWGALVDRVPNMNPPCNPIPRWYLCKPIKSF